MEEFKAGCAVKPNPVENAPTEEHAETVVKNVIMEEQKMIKVGKPAPNFNAQAFYQGKFVNVSLEEFKGKWVYLCFYPGDFTFV